MKIGDVNMGRPTIMKVIAGPTIPEPWDAKGRWPISKAEGDYDYYCGTCRYVLYKDRYEGDIKSGAIKKCPVCGSTLQA